MTRTELLALRNGTFNALLQLAKPLLTGGIVHPGTPGSISLLATIHGTIVSHLKSDIEVGYSLEAIAQLDAALGELIDMEEGKLSALEMAGALRQHLNSALAYLEGSTITSAYDSRRPYAPQP